ncbi:DUF2520 domain-containing protein [Lewinella sp. IMCC34183]|uniref:DUF2520 domain-containing protein n=1 Tax=Lewinella sp. IMCC34183 TaxID=2248762 RepID=UPI000E248891|nr:DUF2520 domain-containing protein [Lewinella sp. IMCC34183]
MSRIVIVGNGHLAWHLGGVLGPERARIVSRDPGSASEHRLVVSDYESLRHEGPEAVFLAVPDNHIATTSERLTGYLPADIPVFHTSGATPAARISAFFDHRGVLWPIRSLRRGEVVTDWRDLPLVIYGSTDTAAEYLRHLAGRLSDTVAWLDDGQRAQLHLAAVFSNNFVTALYEVAYQLCAQEDIPFELLLPIIRNTAGQQDGRRPADRQTGAAARGDTATMERHLSLLDRPAYRQLYREISALILQYRLPQDDPDFRGDTDNNLQDQRIP